MSFDPEDFSATILESLRQSLVFAGPRVVNRDYHGERLVMDQAKCWGFKVDDADEAEHVLPVVASEVAHALAPEIDRHVANRYTEITNAIPGVTATANPVGSDVYDQCLIPMGVALDEAGAPHAGRYVIVPPVVYRDLLRDSRFVKAADGSRNGKVGRAANFNVYMSNHCAQPTTGVFVIQAGTPDAIDFTERVDNIEVHRSTWSPDSIEGLARYGCRITKPNHLACCQVTFS